MKQAIHLFKKDFRRLRPMIIVLLIFLALQVWLIWKDPLALHSSGFNFSGESGPVVVQDYSSIYALLEFILTIFLYVILMKMTEQLIHEDPPAGKPFWRTRPISKRSLLASKCGFLFLFGVVAPVIADFMVLFHYGLEPRDIIPSLVDIFSIQVSLLAVFFAVAVLTLKPFPFVTAVLTLIIFLILVGRSAPEPLPLQIYLACWMSIALSFIVIVHQYWTRRRLLSTVIFIAGILLVTGTNLDRYIAKTYTAWATARNPEIDNLKLAFNNIDGNSAKVQIESSPQNTSGIIMGLDIPNLPPSSAAELLQLKGILRYPGGARIPIHCTGTAFPDEISEPGILLRPNCQVDEKMLERYGNTPGDFSGEAIFRLVRYTTEGRLPLKQGSCYKNGSKFLSVYQASLGSKSVNMTLMVRSLVSSRLNLRAPITTLEGNTYTNLKGTTYPKLVGNKSFMGSQMLLFGGPVIEHSGDSWQTYPYDESSAFDPERISHMDILIRNKTATGPFVREFEAKNIRLEDYTQAAWARHIH
jgi:hypothetical protein